MSATVALSPSGQLACFNDRLDRQPEEANPFQRLAQECAAFVDASPGTTFADIDHRVIEELMRRYRSDATEWERFALADPSRAYTRNLVSVGSEKHNLLVLVWSPGKSSPVHDHADAHCVMKVLQGQLEEILYEWPDDGQAKSRLAVKRTTRLGVDDVTYMSDQLGLHRIGNPDPDNFAVSLHLYTPPNAARHGCHIFDEATGRKAHAGQCGFFSVGGRQV